MYDNVFCLCHTGKMIERILDMAKDCNVSVRAFQETKVIRSCIHVCSLRYGPLHGHKRHWSVVFLLHSRDSVLTAFLHQFVLSDHSLLILSLA